jgi:hypothetical protein
MPACSRIDRGPTLEEIVAENTRALGGEAALANVQSVLHQRSASVFTLQERPNLLLVVVVNDTGGISYAEGYDGQTAWEVLNDSPKRESTDRARVALWHTTQWPSVLTPLSQMSAAGHELRLVGTNTVDDVSYHELRLTLSDGFGRAYYVNPATMQIERARDSRRLHAYEDDIQPIESTWSDYRQVDGVWLPFTAGERNYETGKQLSGGTVHRILLNVSVPREVFSLDGSLAPFMEIVHELRSEQ